MMRLQIVGESPKSAPRLGQLGCMLSPDLTWASTTETIASAAKTSNSTEQRVQCKSSSSRCPGTSSELEKSRTLYR